MTPTPNKVPCCSAEHPHLNATRLDDSLDLDVTHYFAGTVDEALELTADSLGEPLELTPQDEADLAAIAADPEPSANPAERAITAVQYVDKVHEVLGGGEGISVYFGAMLGQLGEWLEETEHETDFGHFSIYGVRTTEPELMEDHTIVPIGTLKLIMTARVKPATR